MIHRRSDLRQRSLRLTLLCLVAVMPSLASHALTEVDIEDPQDGSRLVSAAILDETTELLYLRTSFTTGLTFEDVVLGEGGWIEDGWSIATTEETCSLIANAGIINCPGQSSPGQPDFDTTEIVDLVGDGDRIFAVFDDSDQGSSELVGALDVSAGSTPAAAIFLDFTSASVVFGSNGGVLLVRPAPEPMAGMSLSLGVLMISVLSAKKQRG